MSSEKRLETSATNADSHEEEYIPIVPAGFAPPASTSSIDATVATVDEDVALIVDDPNQLRLYGAIPLIRLVPEEFESCNNSDLDPVYRDGVFAIIFLVHLGLMALLGFTYAPRGLAEIHKVLNITYLAEQIQHSDDVSPEDYQKLLQWWAQVQAYVAVYPIRIITLSVLPSCFVAFIISFVTTTFCIKAYPRFIVASSLLGPLFAGITAAMYSSLFSSSWSGERQDWRFTSATTTFVTLLIFSLIIYFILSMWHLIPYAAVNLSVALQGISSSHNCGTYLLAFLLAELNAVWIFAWLYVAVGVLSWQGQQNCSSGHTTIPAQSAHSFANEGGQTQSLGYGYDVNSCGGSQQGWTFMLMLISLFWTSAVIANALQVTVAGVMATWCYDKCEARGCCSPAVSCSLFRSLTFSFGSICLGSLVQAWVSILRSILTHFGRRNDRGYQHRSITEQSSLFVLLEDVCTYVSQWAFVFVGIYGYSYWESGKRVTELFEARGWTSLITNSLVNYTLVFTTLLVGVLNGVTSILIEELFTFHYERQNSRGEPGLTPVHSGSYAFGPLPGWRYWAFGIGFTVGITVCSVMMQVVQGAVNTLIVCWADAPGKLEENHPDATRAMTTAWGRAFPESSGYFSVPHDEAPVGV